MPCSLFVACGQGPVVGARAIRRANLQLRAGARPVGSCVGDRDGTSFYGEYEADCVLGDLGGSEWARAGLVQPP